MGCKEREQGHHSPCRVLIQAVGDFLQYAAPFAAGVAAYPRIVRHNAHHLCLGWRHHGRRGHSSGCKHRHCSRHSKHGRSQLNKLYTHNC